MGQRIDLVVGLGNPDPEYLTTRHNAGFWFVDLLAAQHGELFSRDKKLHGETAEVYISAQRIRLLKPMTYMNESGRAVAAAVHYYKIPTEQVLVVYDELDLPPGQARLKFDGGHAGHNGMRSVIDHVGPQFWRLRLGVGHPGPRQRERVVGHVLRRATNDEEQLIMNSIRDALEALPVMLESGAELAKNRLHAPKQSPSEPPGDGDDSPTD